MVCAMDSKHPSTLKIIQVGMHERGAGGGVDRIFWDLNDHLKPCAELDLNAFFFWHRSDRGLAGPGEFCLGSTKQPIYQRLWDVRQAVLGELRALADPNASLVGSHFALYASALLPNLSRMNHVVHFHGPWAAETAAERTGQVNIVMKRAIELAVYSSAKALITLSEAFKDLLVAEYRVEPARVHVIPGGVDLKQFCPGDRDRARGRLGWPRDAAILFCVRRLVRRMGLENLLEAFAELAGQHPESILIIGGSGPLRSELEALVRSRSLSGQVRFTGFIPDSDLPLAYRAADLSIVPSQSLEGFGLTALESLACGTPVFVTRVGGLPEVVGPLDPNLVFPGNDSGTIAGQLDLFLNGKVCVPSAERCRGYVEENFSWGDIAQRVKALYWRVARGEES